jgi:hypothetical protein
MHIFMHAQSAGISEGNIQPEKAGSPDNAPGVLT